MARFRLILVVLLFVELSVVWSFELSFVTWPNDTNVVVNETVKFLWKCHARNTDVNIRWGTLKFLSRNLSKFKEEFFTAKNYDPNRRNVMKKNIPARYRGRVRIVGQASLQIINVTLEDEGHYVCEISDSVSWKTLSRAATLRVLVPPTIESHPEETILLSEENQLKLGCKASGRPVPDVSWYKDGVELTQDTGSSEYIKEKVSRGDDGNYKCVARNNASQEQYVVQVIVRFAPEIIRLYPPELNLTKNDPLKLSCEASGFPKPTITWTKEDGATVLNSGNNYEKPKVDENDAGIYFCTASNKIAPDARQSLHVNVFYKPIIDKKKSSIKVAAREGKTIELKCISHANPAPSFEWQKDKNVSLGFESTFVIDSVKKSDFGIYSCLVDNIVGTTIHNVNVFEVEKPIVKDLKVSHIRARSAHITWKLVADKNFPIKRRMLSYSLVNDKKNVTIWIPGDHRHSHKIKDLKPYSNYSVTVQVWNEYIESERKEQRFQTDTARPGPPGKLHFKILSLTSVRVRWSPLEHKNGVLLQYVLQYALANDSSTLKEIKQSGAKTSATLTKLDYGKTYRLRVRAKTKAGKGEFCQYTPFRIPTSRTSTPRELKQIKKSANIYILYWKRPENFRRELAAILVSMEWNIRHSNVSGNKEKKINTGKYFRRRFRREAGSDWKVDIIQLSAVRKLQLSDLFPNTHYTISIKEGMKFKNDIQWSEESDTVVIETPEGAPSKPRNLTVYMQSDKSFTLTWKRPAYSGRKLMKYSIFSRAGGSEEWNSRIITNGLKNETVAVTIDGLIGTERYEIKVQAIGREPGLFSNTVELMQESELLKIKVEIHSKNSFTVTWPKPSSLAANITKYTIYYRQINRDWKSKEIMTGLNNKTLFMRVNGLAADALYQVKLQARSSRQVLLSKKSEVRSAKVEARKDEETDYVPMFGGIIAGVLIFAFVIIVVAMFVRYNYRKRQRNDRCPTAPSYRTPGVLVTRENGLTHMSSPSDHLSSDSPGSEKYLKPERKGNSVQVPSKLLGGATKPIPTSNLSEYCKEHRNDGNKGFAEEFKSIDSSVRHPYEECKKPVNKTKNRYANIVTYDHTRVCLSNLGDPGSDYINANYVDGYNGPEKFIATQGPVASTFSDFWRMIWEQNCAAIVMVTNLIEKGKVKCQKYWPVTEAELFGSLTVNPIEEWELTDYTIRKFQLQQNNNSDLVRDVTQFHYTTWPDHGVPTQPSRLLAFIRRIQNYILVTAGKVVVHCSAGVGRAGTFIALDSLLDQMKAEGVVDVYGFVSHMRAQRNSMVQTEAQYSFIYEALLEASICGDTQIAVPDFSERLKFLDQVESEDRECSLAKEFKNLNTLTTDQKETYVNALMPENQQKNRDSSILPYDNTRVKLWPYPNEKGSDYINASFIDGYRNREIFIATQAPLKESLEDFWRMTWEYECYVLVMLANCDEEDECLQYWPSQREEYVVFGLLMIEVESEEEMDCYIRRTLKCTNTKSGEVRKISHLHYTAWVDHGVPASAASVMNFSKDILKLEQQTGNGLTVIHCSDGSGRTGTLMTLYIALERLKLESIIDVFSVVRNLRTQRVGMVENLEQYRFCYYALEEHVKGTAQSYL